MATPLKNNFPIRKNSWSYRPSMFPSNRNANADASDAASVADSQTGSTGARSPSVIVRRSSSIFPQKSRRPVHVFQRSADERQTKALKRYEWACQNYKKVKKVVRKKCGKEEDEVLMENINLYRRRVETVLAFDKARAKSGVYYGEDVWEMSLRDHWTRTATIGTLYSNPQHVRQVNNLKAIERIGDPLKENVTAAFFKGVGKNKLRKKSRWGPFDIHLQELEKNIEKAEPHKPDFYGFEVVGCQVPNTDIYEEDMLTTWDADDMLHEIEEEQEERMATNKIHLGPGADMSSSYEFFPAKVELISKGGCFNVMQTSGCLAPKESRHFVFNFKSEVAGSFMEIWRFCTVPLLPEELPPLFLKGMAVNEDINREERCNIGQILQDGEMRHGVEEVIREIIESASRATCLTKKTIPGYLYSTEAYRFMKSNLLFGQPVYYSDFLTSQIQKILFDLKVVIGLDTTIVQEITTDAPKSISEEESITRISQIVQTIPDDQRRTTLFSEVEKLVDLAAMPPHPSSLFHLAIYQALYNATNHVAEVIENTIEEVTEIERALKEAAAAKREEENFDLGSSQNTSFEDLLENDEGLERKSWLDCSQLLEKVKGVLAHEFSSIEGDIGSMWSIITTMLDAKIQAIKILEFNETNQWNIFALEREKLYLVLSLS